MRATNPSTPSWSHLGFLRRRGQKPADCVWVTDDARQRYYLELSGAFAVGFPAPREDYLVAGLDVVIIADLGERSKDVARRFLSASPRYFATYWRGRGLSVVIA